MGYGIFKSDGKWPPTAPEDSQPIGWNYRATGEECEGGEVYVEELSTGDVWDAASQDLRARTAAETLADARSDKEAELRDAADSWYQANVRSFEGAIVTAKYGRSGLTALNTEERAVFDLMSANYTRLKNLIVQARAAATVEALEAIAWTP